MFIRDLSRHANPVGAICRVLLPDQERLRLLCLKRIAGRQNASDILEFQARIVSSTNSFLARHRRDFRLAWIEAHRDKQHHVSIRWVSISDGFADQPPTLINLYPPSRRKNVDEDHNDDADTGAETPAQRSTD